MITVLSNNQHKAKKEYYCNFCGGKIQVGEVYHRQVSICGILYTWRSHIKCDKISGKLNMYDECSDEGLTGDDFCEYIKLEYDKLQNEINKEKFDSADFVYPNFQERLDFVCNYHLNNKDHEKANNNQSS